MKTWFSLGETTNVLNVMVTVQSWAEVNTVVDPSAVTNMLPSVAETCAADRVKVVIIGVVVTVEVTVWQQTKDVDTVVRVVVVQTGETQVVIEGVRGS